VGRFRKQFVDSAEKSCKPAQIHLIVANDASKRLHGSAAQVVEIKLRDKRRRNIVLTMPAHAGRVEDVALEFHQPHRTEAQFPQRARGMQQIKMRRESWRGDAARHCETILKQWPIERFSVEGNEHRPLGHTLR